MTLPAVGDAAYPTPAEVRDAILSAIKYGLARRNITANVLPGSDRYVTAEAYAAQVSIAIANNQISQAGFNPLNAIDDDLDALMRVFGVPQLTPAKSSGYATIVVTSGTVTVPVSYRATSSTGLKYDTTSTSVGLSNGASVALQCTTAGSAGDLDAGAQLTWDSASIGNLGPVITVASGGITGGTDEEGNEDKRRRLLDRLAFPQGGGNWAQVRAYAREASSAVKYVWAFPSAQGPGSYDVVIASDDPTRVLSATVCNTVSAYVQGKMPGVARINVTSVALQSMDIVLAMSLPLPESAGGAGGGWIDSVPWPVENTKVTAYNSGTGVATCNATTTPVAGNNIAIWDATTEAMVNYVVASGVGGSAGAWTFTVVGGFNSTPLASYISARAANLDSYASEFYAQIVALGCGEKTTNPDILPTGRRQPGPDIQEPSDLTSQLLKGIQTDHAEVLDLNYGARYLTGTTTTQTSPSVPSTTADAPKVFALAKFAIRKA